MSTDAKFLEKEIYKNHLLKEIADLIADDTGNADVYACIDNSVEIANTIDKAVNHGNNWDDLLVAVLTANFGTIAREHYGAELPRDIRNVIDHVEKLIDAATGSSRSERNYRNSNNRDDRRSSNSGFGKGSRQEETREETRTSSSKNIEYKGKNTIAYDEMRFKLNGGVIVESYQEHELSDIGKTFDRVGIEKTRKLFVEDSRDGEMKMAPITYSSFNDFVNTTSEQPLEVGLVTRTVNYTMNENSFLEEVYLSTMDNDAIKTVMSILAKTKSSTEPVVIRFRKRLNRLATDALTIAFNMYSKVGGDFEGEVIGEWEETQRLLDDPKIFDPSVGGEVREVFKGILKHYCELERQMSVTKNGSVLSLKSTHFVSKVAGDFVSRTKIAGEARLAVIKDDHNPELDAAVTAALEVRDGYFGDAWSEVGMMPLAITDTNGQPLFVYATKASTTKFLLCSLNPIAFTD